MKRAEKTASLFGDETSSEDTVRGGQPVHRPLAERLRPVSVDEVVGQDHLLGPGRPLRAALDAKRPHSMILWGPPGVGKTTLARLMANAFDVHFISLSAVMSGVKDIREAVEVAQVMARSGRGCIVFVDEVHRFNKAQQDAFLPHVESGLFVFIGATTENPSFEVNSALLSRASVHVLSSLDDAALRHLFERGLKALNSPVWTRSAQERLLAYADGDARRMLNALEQVAEGALGLTLIDDEALTRILGAALRRFDKGGDQFYDAISALHKSVRGSDPDAALYWLARMLDGGVDPRYVARRVLRMASEDVGLADPRALTLALHAADVYERLGSPEGELALAQAITFLAVAPKSNAVYTAWKAAVAHVRRDVTRPVPLHLRNAPTSLMKSLEHGKGYRHAHDEPDGFAAGERYLPDGLDDLHLYQPVDRGLETQISQRLAQLRQRNREARSGLAVRPPGSQAHSEDAPLPPEDSKHG